MTFEGTSPVRDRETDDEEERKFPPGPAWAVGADGEHQGPSAMGPGDDRPGFAEEIDVEDAEGVAGGFLRPEPPAD